MGNLLNYMGATMKWDVKGNLTSVSNRNGKSATYKYLSDGQRYTKTTGGKTTTYLYNNGLLLSETTGTEVIHYYYDSDGTILGIGYKKGTAAEKHYFFEKNAFGDVIAIYRNSDSVLIGTYEYDLWGNPISVKEAASGRDTDGILQKNPFRYRCYYYDVETGFYYLNARYYDPQVRRFISADDQLAEIGASVIGYNLYKSSLYNLLHQSSGLPPVGKEAGRRIHLRRNFENPPGDECNSAVQRQWLHSFLQTYETDRCLTYDGFGNVIDTKIAGKTVSTNTYAANNGRLTGTKYCFRGFHDYGKNRNENRTCRRSEIESGCFWIER